MNEPRVKSAKIYEPEYTESLCLSLSHLFLSLHFSAFHFFPHCDHKTHDVRRSVVIAKVHMSLHL